MSEYWKSTPKYWCKFCETYVRDTPNDRKQHEQTGKHQGGIQKSLRELHKRKEQDERDKQRAQSEVARLKRLAGERESPKLGSPSHVAKTKPSFTAAATKATVEDRRRQMEQLAAMGVAVPEEYKRDMAIVSDWSTVSETPIYSNEAPVKGEDDGENKEAVGAFGVRKRKLDDEEADVEQAAAKASRKNWGSTLKAYPGAKAPEPEADLDALLSAPVVKKEEEMSPAVAQGPAKDTTASLKQEESTTDGAATLQAIPQTGEPAAGVKNEDDATAATNPTIVFKKRKGKR